MKELIFILPAVELESFKKFTSRMQKHIPELNIEYGKLYSKIYLHTVHTEDGNSCQKVWHNVYDVKATMPSINEWQLLATYKDGYLFIADLTNKIVFSNPAHGEKYNKCDVCGHWCKNSYVVCNTTTGEELQVGCECAKKFGLQGIEFVYQFTKELYRMYNFYCSFDNDDDKEPSWRGSSDPGAFSSVETSNLLKAAKLYYNDHPAWIKGFYQGRTYIQSSSNNAIQLNLEDSQFDGTDDYVKKVCDYIKSLPVESEFAQEMFDVASSFYAQPANASHAYFMIKSYEEYIEKQKLNLMQLSEGMQVKVEGVIVTINKRESIYGMMTTYKIKTNKGYIVERTGVIPIVENEDKQTTSFFALVKHVSERRTILDRALKNPKKGMEVVCL